MAKRVLLLLLLVLLSPFPAAGSGLDAWVDNEDYPYHNFLPQIFAPLNAVEGCAVISQTPEDNAIIHKSESFDMSWTIRNGSRLTWEADSTEIRFVSGDRVHVGNDVRDIAYDVPPNGLISIIIPMAAPSSPGSYVTNWSLSQGNTSVCRFFLQFQVQ